jgi:hypothetical protein
MSAGGGGVSVAGGVAVSAGGVVVVSAGGVTVSVLVGAVVSVVSVVSVSVPPQNTKNRIARMTMSATRAMTVVVVELERVVRGGGSV